MTILPLARRVALLAALAPGALAQGGTGSLAPAGSIRAAVGAAPRWIVCEPDPAAQRFAQRMRQRFFREASVATEVADGDDGKGHTLVVIATPRHPLLQQLGERLPFRFGEGTVEIDGRTFRGDRLRVIAALRNPFDPARAAVFYTAAHVEDLPEINALYHGPTEWVVADGDRTLASGSFLHGVELTAAQQAADLDALVALLREVHPACTDGDPEPFAATIAAARERVAATATRMAFTLVLAEVAASLHDAHTAVALPLRSDRLDLPCDWLPDGPVATQDTNALRRGDRILAIGGVAVATLGERLTKIVPAENPQWRHVQAARLLADPGLLAHLGAEVGDGVRVRVARGGSEREVEVGRAQASQSRARPDWVRFAIGAEHSLGILTLDRCNPDDHYRDVLARFFAAVRDAEVTRVAVDLRANSGGNSRVIDEFLRYLDVDGYVSFGGEARWSSRVLERVGGDGAPRIERFPPQRQVNDRVAQPFAGDLFVLVGPHTFSSGNWFAVVVQDNGLGQVVGEPTGNAPSSFGDVLPFTVPASGTSCSVSWKHWLRPDPTRDPSPSLQPDVVVARTAETVAAGSDPVMDWLRRR